MTPLTVVAIAVVFVWLGAVVGISFIEAPITFRAPGVRRVARGAVLLAG